MSDNQTPPPVPKKAGIEIGKSGTLITQGMISSEEYNADLRGPSLIRKVEIMRRSNSTIRAALLVVKLPILGADWGVKPAQDGDGNVADSDREISDHVNRELFGRNINFSNFLREGLTCQEFGYSVFEKVYEPVQFNGKFRFGIKKIGYRKQNTIFKWEQSNSDLPGITQLTRDGKQFDIPREKLIVFTNDKEGDNYEGISLLRYAFMDWDMLDKLKISQAIKLDRFSVGVPKAFARDGLDPGTKDIEEAKEILRNMRTNQEAFLLMPSTMDVEMLDMKMSGTEDIIPFLNYLDRRISTSILAGFMELGGQSGSGAHALAKDLTALFMKSEEATAKNIQATIQEDLIKQLVDINWTQDELVNGYPQITFGNIADDDLSQLSTSVSALADKSLITPDIDLESHLRKTYRLPAMSADTRKAYEESQRLKREGAQIAHDNLNNGAPATDSNTNDPTLNKTTIIPNKPDPQKVKASLEAAQAEARKTRNDLIDAITS